MNWKKTYNLLNEWRFVVTEKQTHFKKSLSIINEFFELIDRFFSSQRQFWSFEYSLSKNKNPHILKNQFVQMSVYFWRSIEKNKNTNVFQSMSSQKFFQIDLKSQFAFKTIIQQEFFQSDSVSEFHLKSITLVQFVFVSEVRLIFHKNFHFISFFFDVLSILSVQFVFVSEIRLMFHKNSSHSIQSRFDAQSTALISDKSEHNARFPLNVQSIFHFSKIDSQLISNYLSNRQHKLRRDDAQFSFLYSFFLIDFVFETFKLSLFYESNILNMKFNATNLNLNSNDSNNVVKLTQVRLYSMIDFINFSIRFITQMISIKKIQNSFKSDNFKQSRSKNVNSEFIEKKNFKWKFEYYIESFKTNYSSYSKKFKDKNKKKTK